MELCYQEVIMLMHYTHNLPHKFAGLMNLDDDETKKCMKEIETMWGVYLDLEEGAKKSDRIRAELRLLSWPLSSYVLETLVSLAEDEFTKPDRQQHDELMQFIRAPRTSEIAERGFNECRAVCPVKGKRMGADRIAFTLRNSGIADVSVNVSHTIDRPPTQTSHPSFWFPFEHNISKMEQVRRRSTD